MVTFKEGQKRFVAVAMSVLLVATPILGGCTSSKATQQASEPAQEVQADSPHAVALSATLSFVDKVGDNLRAVFDLTALSGQFAENLSGSDVKLGMDLANAKVGSFMREEDPTLASLVVEFPANGRTPDTISGYGDIVVDSKALRDAKGNEGVTAFPAVVSLASQDMTRGDDDFKMPITKDQFDKYSTYVNKVGKTLGLKKDTVNDIKEAENYVSQALGIGEDLVNGNYLKAGQNFLRAIGIIKTSAGKTDSMKLDEIINMLHVIETKLDRQTKLIEEISNKIDAAAIASFKKELGELKNYVGYVNAYLEYAANNLADEGISLSNDANAKSTDKVLNSEDYSVKLIETAKKIGDSGAISYDAATNGLVDHFSSVTSFLSLNDDQNPIKIYYNYMTHVYNFDTQAYIETGLYMQDIDVTLQNVTALLYATTDAKNVPLLKKFEDQYNNAANALYAHAPQEPEWAKPYSFVLGSKVSLNAGILRVYIEDDDKWRPDFSDSQANDFASRMHYGTMIDELYSAGFTKYYVPAEECQDHWRGPKSCPDRRAEYIDVPIEMQKGEYDLNMTVLTNGFNDSKCSGLAFRAYKDGGKRNFHDVSTYGIGLDGKTKKDKVCYISVATGVGPTIWGTKDYSWSFWFKKI